MNVKEYAEIINELAKKHPDLPVVYSCDDEGNNFSFVVYSPSTGNYEIECGRKKVAAVCVN